MIKTLKVDSKGRITLGRLAKGYSSFNVELLPDSKFLLEPMIEIPAREKWLYDNKIALNKVKKGLREAKGGQVTPQGNFSKYLEIEKE